MDEKIGVLFEKRTPIDKSLQVLCSESDRRDSLYVLWKIKGGRVDIFKKAKDPPFQKSIQIDVGKTLKLPSKMRSRLTNFWYVKP